MEGALLSENHQQFSKKVKIMTSLVAFFEMLPKLSGVSDQEAATKIVRI